MTASVPPLFQNSSNRSALAPPTYSTRVVLAPVVHLRGDVQHVPGLFPLEY